ncbi:MAG: hypothetical protein QM820_07935 [Minicystis sp.]
MSGGFEAFLRLSAALTGFTETDLLGTGQAEAYFRWVEEHVPLTTREALYGRTPVRITDDDVAALLARPPLGLVAKQINYLWYTAQWQEIQNGNLTVTAIVSPAAYQEALVWPAMLAHPPGAKQTGFASWTTLPTEGDAS